MEQAEDRLGAFLVNQFGDRYLYSVNRNAFNGIGSDALYRSLYGDKIFATYQLNIIIGTDSGIFPRFIAKNGVPEGSRYLFVELPEVRDLLVREGLLSELPDEIRVTTFEAWSVQAKKFQLTDYVFIDGVNLQGSLASSDANLLEYRDLSWDLNLELKTSVHQVHASTNCSQFIRRQLENLAENRTGFAQTLVRAFADRAAIILAGGPSLKEALPWVRENRDRVLIIAVSRISRILLDEGIVPHLIVTVDPQQISFEVSREMLLFPPGPDAPLLVNSHHASPLLVGQWPGRSVYTASLFPWRSELNRDELFYTGPTVGNYALSIAMHLGCREIVLAGVDLCFTPKGQTHAAGSNENKVGPDLGQFSPRLETYGGWQADTNQGYAEALNVLAVQGRLAAHNGHRLYNCSRGAAVVPLIEFLDLDAFQVPESEATPAQIIAEAVPEPTRASRLAHYRVVEKELTRARRKFQEILDLSREALDCADGLFGTNGKKQEFKHKIRMDKIERRLDTSYRDFTKLVKQFGLKKFLAILKAPRSAEEWSDQQVEDATRNYYEAYREGTQNLINLVDEALERVGSRIEEEKERPDFGLLFARWEKDCELGRLPLFRGRRLDSQGLLAALDQDEVQRLEEEFRRVMTEERTSQIKLLEELHDVRHTRSKALILFNRGESEELKTMEVGLSGHPNQEKALPYLHFVRGLIAELKGEVIEAVEEYQHLLEDSSHPLTEDALQQIASLSIGVGDLENALLTVECLAGISTAYLPPYGELLKAVGRFEDAFNVYNRYVGLAPEDVGALMKLGMLCREAGLKETSEELFRRVIALDPQNGAAQALLSEGGAHG